MRSTSCSEDYASPRSLGGGRVGGGGAWGGPRDHFLSPIGRPIETGIKRAAFRRRRRTSDLIFWTWEEARDKGGVLWARGGVFQPT